MLLKLALAVMAGHRLGALEGGGGYLPPFQCIPGDTPPTHPHCVTYICVPALGVCSSPQERLQSWGAHGRWVQNYVLSIL